MKYFNGWNLFYGSLLAGDIYLLFLAETTRTYIIVSISIAIVIGMWILVKKL